MRGNLLLKTHPDPPVTLDTFCTRTVRERAPE
jgi:hypothetical protein